MIQKVENKKQLKTFIMFTELLYKNDPNYVSPILFALTRELRREVLDTQNYTGLLCYQDNELKGRILYTIDESKKQGKQIGYYSFFESVDDISVTTELFDYMETDLKSKNIDYVEGTFSPYDPDTRRGILVKGFETPPVVFTSYNKDYYGRLLEDVGCKKAVDTVLLDAFASEKSRKRLNTVSKYFSRSHDVRVDPVNLKDLDNDLKDVHEIIEKATNEIIYQDAPSMDMVENAARQLKMFIEPSLIRIARENETNKPVGFCLVMPDYNQIFKKTKGRLRPLRFMILKRKITKARGMMQYIIPEYQNTGLIGYMFKAILDTFDRIGITHFEAGTMMEDNPKPINAFKKFGGEIIKVYRIYGKSF